ncbi:hypothetical protein HHI36_016910 [Cryptolaemus montrouzieri]|uniref:DDE-1 domain-containing protein n=1 Tax=Cryptolaemus montrouzieri TaxID=559131 RepID=A0ABD2NLC4_9CUCU
MVPLPPHTSHKLQPLDFTFFGPLKNALNRECDLYLSTHSNEKTTHYELAAIFDKTYVKVATMDKVDLIPGSSETNQGLDVPIETLVPVPKLKTNQTNKSRAEQHSEIFTSTPLKSVLEKKQEKRNLKKEAEEIKKEKNGKKKAERVEKPIV